MPASTSDKRKSFKNCTALEVVADLDLTGKHYLITGGNGGIGTVGVNTSRKTEERNWMRDGCVMEGSGNRFKAECQEYFLKFFKLNSTDSQRRH